ncbi:MAG: hypothetical protein ABTA16_12445 [Niallia sp.]
MKTLIVYDNDGKIFSQISGDYLKPVGIPYLEIEYQEGKTIVSVDVSVTPHKAVIIDNPKSETQLIKERLEATEQMLLQMMLEGMN